MRRDGLRGRFARDAECRDRWPAARQCGLAAALLAIVATVFAWQAPAQAGPGRWSEGYVPNVPVVTQDGKTVRFYDDLVRGRIVVISFIYTTCRDICPLMTARLALAAQRLQADMNREIYFISISIDPRNDTPERLKEHAAAFGAGPGWTFVTGEPANINLIRHRLGERSRRLIEHRSEILLGNDRTGEWAHDSAFTDTDTLAATILAMDPARRTGAAAGLRAVEPNVDFGSLGGPGQALFQKACAACHAIGGGRRVGPDLKGVLDRRGVDWTRRYIMAPERVRASGDASAAELARQYRGLRMPNLSLSDNDADDIVAFLSASAVRANAPAQKRE